MASSATAAPRGEIQQLKAAEVEAAAIVSAAREERKSKLRQAQGEAKREVDEYRGMRDAKLRTVQPEAEALSNKVARLAGETDRKIANLEAEYQRNKEPVLQLLMQVVMNIENPYAK